ncbi:hypothetical protein NQZ68_012915 [Dissostichus eleginoides]|nr:hypothetical protein NQZ68_012915 [Dissostichus eleginoides]
MFHTRNYPLVLDQNLTEDFEPVLASIKSKGLAMFECGWDKISLEGTNDLHSKDKTVAQQQHSTAIPQLSRAHILQQRSNAKNTSRTVVATAAAMLCMPLLQRSSQRSYFFGVRPDIVYSRGKEGILGRCWTAKTDDSLSESSTGDVRKAVCSVHAAYKAAVVVGGMEPGQARVAQSGPWLPWVPQGSNSRRMK